MPHVDFLKKHTVKTTLHNWYCVKTVSPNTQNMQFNLALVRPSRGYLYNKMSRPVHRIILTQQPYNIHHYI